MIYIECSRKKRNGTASFAQHLKYRGYDFYTYTLMMIGRVERERDSVQMSQRDMGENCYMTGYNMKIGNICPK